MVLDQFYHLGAERDNRGRAQRRSRCEPIEAPSRSGHGAALCARSIGLGLAMSLEYGLLSQPASAAAPQGWLDAASWNLIGGWARDPHNTTALAVHIYIDENLAHAMLADAPRADPRINPRAAAGQVAQEASRQRRSPCGCNGGCRPCRANARPIPGASEIRDCLAWKDPRR